MKTKTIKPQTMRTLLLLLLFVSGFAYAQPSINNPTPYEVCDDNSDGVAAFDLHFKDAEILGSLNPNDYSINYYFDPLLAQLISNSSSFSTSTTNVYCNVFENSNTTNSSFTTMSLMVNPKPIAHQAPDMVQTSSTASANFDLSSQANEILVGNADNTTFYTNIADAQAGTNVITDPAAFTNTTNPQTIGVRVTNVTTGCYSITSFNLIVNPSLINNPTPYVVCGDNNGIASFDLHTKDAEIINGHTNFVVSYYLTFNDSQNGTNEITQNPFQYPVVAPLPLIYVRVVDPANPNNPALTSLSLIVNPKPNFTIENTNICSGSSFATITSVNQGSAGNYTYIWTTPAGATNPGNVATFTTSIAGIYNLLITDLTSTCTTSLTTTVTSVANVSPTFSFPTTFCEGSITALPQTSDNGIIGTWSPAPTVGTTTYTFTPYVGQCSSTYSINITVLAPPTANQAPNLIVVDNPYDGTAFFNLTSQNALINSGVALQFNYFTSLADAQNNVNQIPNPAAYTNSTNPQTIGVRVFDPSSPNCPTITSFNIIVSDPNIVTIPDANFKAKLITLGVDTSTDGNIQYSEASAVTTELNVTGSYIADLTGFEAFTNVPILRCTNNNLSTLNLSNLPNLKTLECGFNSNLTTLNLTNLTSLDTLKVYSNNLSSLNVNNLTSLKHLDCSYNHISTLNVSNLTNLKMLNCASNWLTNLDVTQLTLLEELNCSINQLSTINVVPLVNLKTLICSNNGIHTLSLTNLPNLEHLEYGNNQSTSLAYSNLPNLKYLDCSGNSIVSLNASLLPLLEHLDCSGNHFTSIIVNGLTHLNYFTFALNQVASINVAGLSSLNYLNCSSNQLSSLNVSGLTNLVSLYASNNTISSTDLTNLPNLSIVYFDYNHLTSLDLTGSNNVSNLYCNNNLLTNLNITGLVNLSWLDCHENQLTSIGFNGLTSLYTVLCDHNSLTSLDFSTATNFTNLSCSYNHLNTINIKNGNSNINTNNFWHENPNLTFVCADDGELAAVNQILTQSINVNNGNVVLNSYCSFSPNGNYNTITGQIKLDANNNGCDASDLPRPFIKVNINDGINAGATFTDANGNYKFYTQAGSFIITPEIENTIFVFSPTANTIAFSNNNNNTANYNFCMTTNGIHSDIEVVLEPLSPARPGFDATYKIIYRNKGNVTLTDSINFQFESNKAQFISSTPSPDSFQSGNYLTWDYFNLLPFEEKTIYLTLHVNSPTNSNPVNIGDVLNFVTFSIPLGLSDATPQDNGNVQLHQTVVGSYDPNIITCLEGDSLPTSAIGSYLHYGITFENTGNYEAESVVVKDIIDTTKYDVNSIQLLNTSNPVYTRITGNVVEFIFENINLMAPSGNPPVGGHGDVLFKIKSLSNLVSGDVAVKSAKIYFDYNAPVDTNIAQTVYQSLNNSIHQLDSSVTIYPNPTNSIINISSKFNIKSIELYDVQGRILETSIENSNSLKFDISEKQNGIYFLKINTENGSKVEKIVKE